jgi:hypothetical protein
MTDCEQCGKYPAKNLVTTYVSKGLKMCGYCRNSMLSWYRDRCGRDYEPDYDPVKFVPFDFVIDWNRRRGAILGDATAEETYVWVQPLQRSVL